MVKMAVAHMFVVAHVVHENHGALVLPWRRRAPVAAVGPAQLRPAIRASEVSGGRVGVVSEEAKVPSFEVRREGVGE